MKKLTSIAAAILVALIATVVVAQADDSADVDKKVEKLLSTMTLEEKIGQITQFDESQVGLESLTAGGKTGSVLNMTGV